MHFYPGFIVRINKRIKRIKKYQSTFAQDPKVLPQGKQDEFQLEILLFHSKNIKGSLTIINEIKYHEEKEMV